MIAFLQLIPDRSRPVPPSTSVASLERSAGSVRWTCWREGEEFVVRDPTGLPVCSRASEREAVDAALLLAVQTQQSVRIVPREPDAAPEEE